MKTKISWLVVLGVAFALLPTHAVELTATIETERFIIRYNPKIKERAERISVACETWLDEIGEKLEMPHDSAPKIPVFLYKDQREFREATGEDKQRGVVGRAWREGYIELDASTIFSPLEQVAGHEIVHVVIFRILGGHADALPLWANEGTAKVLSRDWDAIDRTLIANAAAKEELIPLSELSRSFPKDNKASLAYAESTSAILYFIKEYGEPALADLIHKTGETGSFEIALKRVTGLTPPQFEEKWITSVVGSRSLVRLMRFASLGASLLFVFAAIATYFGVKRRRRRVVERFEQEEWESANRRDWEVE